MGLSYLVTEAHYTHRSAFLNIAAKIFGAEQPERLCKAKGRDLSMAFSSACESYRLFKSNRVGLKSLFSASRQQVCPFAQEKESSPS
jgi:hypothetical protein